MPRLSDNVEESDRNTVIEKCEQYLGGIWKRDNFTVSRFSDGFFNKIFYCKQNVANNTNDLTDCERKAVVVKMALEDEFFLYSPFISTINTLLLSKSGLAPKVLGIFPNGMICEYIESRSYNYLDDENPAIVTLLAQKLAKFHSLESPIPRDGTHRWLDVVFDEYFREGMFDGIKSKQMIDIINGSPHECLKGANLGHEMSWVRDAITSAPKILVLSHCDFNRGNILIQQNGSQVDLFFIDFDFTSHNYRGIDLGRYFSSWKHTDPHFGADPFPTDQQMTPFIDAYIQESDRLTGNEFSKNVLNSRHDIDGKQFS
ncbi:unnamed protein product [Medioppia subpectinata]|uniref:Uncharacterized protein n=1 Tax=Medioppia subpectinata TaxID=1979941 RepID=A0A7R9Q7I3_9ACAR|nr:unnamed protein product [Medioppia subpectinata]CAG2115861.1 unnamed protein product [Medioppia subpectinata]